MNLYNFVGFKHLKIKVFCKNNNKDWLKKVHLGGIEPLLPTPQPLIRLPEAKVSRFDVGTFTGVYVAVYDVSSPIH
jgi:hypothetical protein